MALFEPFDSLQASFRACASVQASISACAFLSKLPLPTTELLGTHDSAEKLLHDRLSLIKALVQQSCSAMEQSIELKNASPCKEDTYVNHTAQPLIENALHDYAEMASRPLESPSLEQEQA